MSDVDEATNHIYTAFGTDSGIIFGIQPELRKSVKAIVKATLDWVKEERRYE